MAALDDILSGGTPTVKPKPVQVSPPPIDGQLKDVENSVGSQPVAQPTTTPQKQVVEQTPGTDGQPQEKRQEQTEEKKRLSYVEMFEALNPQKPETAEERAKREKREKREADLAAVGDGISACLTFSSPLSMRPMLMIPPKECRLKRVNGGIDSDWSGKPTAGHILTAISVPWLWMRQETVKKGIGGIL